MGQRHNASAPLLIQKVSVIMKYDLGGDSLLQETKTESGR
jgi:hypothetical protein